MTQHVVFGAGLIGGFVGGVLSACAKQSDDVILLGRESVMQQLSAGLTLSDYQGNKVRVDHVNALSGEPNEVSQLSTADYVWLTVKCTGVAAAADQLKSVLSKKCVILCCQNGIGAADIVRKTLPHHRVLSVMVPFNVIQDTAGYFHRGSEGTLVIEQSEHDEVLTNSLTGASNSGQPNALLPVTFFAEMQAMQWAKLQLNLGNSVNALANIPVKAMLEQRGFRLVIAAMMQELLAVVDKNGIQLPKVTSVPGHWVPKILRLPNLFFRLVATKMLAIDPTVRTSMWWDLHQQRKTEIDFLNGAVVEEAQNLGLKTPINSAVIALIKQQEGQPAGTRESMSAQRLGQLVGIC